MIQNVCLISIQCPSLWEKERELRRNVLLQLMLQIERKIGHSYSDRIQIFVNIGIWFAVAFVLSLLIDQSIPINLLLNVGIGSVRTYSSSNGIGA